MTYMGLFAFSGNQSSSIGDIDSGVADGTFAFEASLAASTDNENSLTVIDMLDQVDALMSNSPGTGAANVALTIMNSFTGGAVAEQLGCSMENLSGDFTQEAQMGIKEMASKGWDAVLKFIEDMIRRVKVFIATFFDKMPKLKKRAEDLKEKASSTSGSAENSKIKIGGAYSALAGTDKKVTKLADAINSIATIAKGAALDKIPGLIPTDELDKLSGSADEVGKANITGVQSLFSAVTLGNLDAALAKKVPGVTSAKGVPSLPGGKFFAVGFKADQNTQGTTKSLNELRSIKAGFYTADEKLKFDDSTEVDTLATSAVEDICEAVIKVAEELEKSKGVVEKGYKTQEKLLAIAKKIKANADKSDYKDVKGVLNAAKGAIQNMASFAVNPLQQVSAYAYTVASAALSYGEKSLSEYK